ncbi:hypothetical protein VTO73DRAFT_12249 [Trametes versicolor]
MDLPPALRTGIQEELACVIIGFALSTTLYGVTLLQGYLYYRTYQRDSLKMKLLICVLLVIDSMTTIFMAHALYTYSVIDFRDPLKLIQVIWSFAAEEGLAVCRQLSFYKQNLTGCQCFILKLFRNTSVDLHKNGILVGLIFFFAFANLGSGLAIMADEFINPDVSDLATVRTRVLAGVCSGCSSLCDILIAGGLCYYLQTGRSGLKKTDTLVDKLMVYAVHRGILTTVCQVLHLALTVALPGHVYFLPFAMIESKIYINALLATLNVRKSLAEGGSIKLSRTVYDTDALNADAQTYEGGSVTTIGFVSAGSIYNQGSMDKGLPVV